MLALPLAVVGLARTSYKRVNLEFIEFGGQLSIDTKVRGDAKDLSAFLTPQRIVESAWNPANVERLPSPSEDRACFRLKQDEVTFVALRVNTYVDVDVVSVGDRGGVTLESKDIICKASWANQAEKQLDVRIKLVGELKPQAASGAARVRGNFDFTVSGKLVGPLLLTPDPLIRVAADLIDQGVLQYANSRFVRGIESSFARWLREGSPPEARR